jgi:hypothetical protein
LIMSLLHWDKSREEKRNEKHSRDYLTLRSSNC